MLVAGARKQQLLSGQWEVERVYEAVILASIQIRAAKEHS